MITIESLKAKTLSSIQSIRGMADVSCNTIAHITKKPFNLIASTFQNLKLNWAGDHIRSFSEGLEKRPYLTTAVAVLALGQLTAYVYQNQWHVTIWNAVKEWWNPGDGNRPKANPPGPNPAE